MKKEEVWPLIQEMEKIMKETDFFSVQTISKEDLEKDEDDFLYVGNQELLINGNTIVTFVRFRKPSLSEYFADIKFNVPVSTESFINTYVGGVIQEPYETKEKFLEKFKTRLYELELETVFKPNEHYNIEKLFSQIECEMGTTKNKIAKEKLTEKLMGKTKATTKEQLNRELITLYCNAESKGKDEFPLAKFFYFNSKNEIENMFNLEIADFIE